MFYLTYYKKGKYLEKWISPTSQMMNLWLSDPLGRVCSHCHTSSLRSQGSNPSPFDSKVEPLPMTEGFSWSLYVLNEVYSNFVILRCMRTNRSSTFLAILTDGSPIRRENTTHMHFELNGSWEKSKDNTFISSSEPPAFSLYTCHYSAWWKEESAV